MSFLRSLDITGSALTAERYRTDIILQNLANLSNTRTANGEAYRRKQVIFQEQPLDFDSVLTNQKKKKLDGGVRITELVESQEDFLPVYDPAHPHANEQGYVMYPNVNRTEEQLDLMSATRAYEANLTALGVVKAMAMKALEIGK